MTHSISTPLADDALGAVAAELAARPYARRGVSMHDEPIRIVLADDHAVVRAGLRAVLASAPDIRVVGEVPDGPAAVALAERLLPDVVVMDLDMPGGDGATATEAMAKLARPPKVLILSMHAEEERLLPLLDAGASGYLSKDAAATDLVDAIRVVASGDVYVRPRVARLLAASVRQRHAPDTRRQQYETLSAREQTVLRLTAEGYNGPEIGRQLGISPKTVDTYKQRIEEKLGLAHRTDYVRLALALDLIAK
ncbi:MAG: response regulator transcription factor [Gemmatirosa sp.]|nr:response regulator transcription factor [Gemmatirosa sp.]